jgi:hypothetical protein
VSPRALLRLANRLVGRNSNSPAIGSRGVAEFLRDSRGTLPCPPVLFCARRSQRPSSPQVSINFVANGIRQLQIQLPTEVRDCHAGSPLQGEGRRFETVSTHQASSGIELGFTLPGFSDRVCCGFSDLHPTSSKTIIFSRERSHTATQSERARQRERLVRLDPRS